MKPRAIPKPYRLRILERLARDGDAYAMYALSRAFPPGVPRVGGATAREWLERAARTLLKAQLELAETDGLPGEESPADLRVTLGWARRAARSGYPDAILATLRGLPRGARRRAAVQRAARRGSAWAAFILATWVETYAGDLAFVRRWLRFAVVVGMHEEEYEFAETLLRRAGPFLRRFGARPAAWRARAAAGDAEALAHVGYARRFGRAEPYDPAGAQAAFEAAAKAGSAEAALALALEIHDCELDVDWDVAADWAARAAGSGDPTALWVAGEHCLQLAPRQRRRAIGWLRQAATGGEARAAYRLACGHAHGGFVPKDLPAALRWARVAARGGHDGAMALTARLLEERARPTRAERREATDWRRRAAACGNYDDWTNWGVRLHQGDGVRRDDRAAVRWYRRAAAHGCPAATANLARCYRQGHGVPKSARLAAKWCRRATEVLENPAGAHLLAEMYRDGELGRPDRRQALRWSCRAAAMGDPEALGEVGIAYHNGAGVAKDQRFAATLYRAAAAGGDAWATYLLGLCIRDGEGAPKSRPAARRWFRIALSRGIPEAGPELARLARTGKASRR